MSNCARGPCADRRRPYHRVRVLLGLDKVGDGDNVGQDDTAGQQGFEARRRVAEAPAHKRARILLREFRLLAALDGAELRPGSETGTDDLTLFPVVEQDAAIPLACVELDVRDADGCTTIDEVRVEFACRTTLLPTATIQELACGLAPGVIDEHAAEDAGGPRVLTEGVTWSEDERTLYIPVSAPLSAGSLRRAIRITSLSARGWVDEDLDGVRYEPDGPAIVVDLADRPVNALIRLIVKGTGPTPVYGADPPVPLAGVWGGPPGSADDGHDAVVSFANNLTQNGEST